MKSKKIDTGRQLYLSELFWHFVASWRRIIVCVVAFAILMVCFGVVSGLRNHTETPNGDKETLLAGLSPAEYEKVMICVRLNEQYRDAMANFNFGNIILIDASHTGIARVSYSVDCDSDEMVGIMETLRLCAIGHKVREAIAADTSIGYREDDLSLLIDVSYAGNILVIELRAENEEKALAMAGHVRKEIEDEIATITIPHQIKEHEIDFFYCGFDKKIADAQNWLNDRVTVTKKVYTSSRDKLTQAGMLALDACLGGVSAPASKPQVTINKKYIVFGAAAGLVLAFIISVMEYIYSSKLVGNGETEQIWNIPMIAGCMDNKTSKRKLGIDKWIRRKRFGTPFEEEQAIARVGYYCKHNKISEVSLLSTVSENSFVKELSDKLIDELNKEGIKATFVGDILSSTDALDKLLEASNVILIEKSECSRYNDIDRTVSFLERDEINIAGTINVM